MNVLLKLLVCFLASMAAGIGTGFAGMSAAAVIGPVLSTFLGISVYQAVAVGLAADVLASALSAWTYKKHDNLDIRGSLLLLCCVMIGTIVGSVVASHVPDRAMGSLAEIGLIIVGFRFLFMKVEEEKSPLLSDDGKAHKIKSVIAGLVIGFWCGFIGAGGGIMLLLTLTIFLGYDMHNAVGTSTFIMIFTALIGSVSHFVISGMPEPLYLISCVVFTLFFAKISATIANKVEPIVLHRVVGVIMILTSAIVLLVKLF